jgi:hypothetical protein
VQRETAQAKKILRDNGVAEAPPGFQAGWSDCIYLFKFYLFLFIFVARLVIPCMILYS